MDNMNFNDANPQVEMGGPMPEGTIATVVAVLRPGGSGPGGWLKPNKVGDALMADFEFTVEGGKYDRRKFWGLFVTEGATEGQQKAATITRAVMRGMLESAYCINPGDDGPEAMTKRQVSGWQSFDGLRFCAKIGIEKGNGEYKDKNILRIAVTPDLSGYINPGPQSVAPGMKTAGAAVASAAQLAGGAVNAAVNGGAKPAWAS